MKINIERLKRNMLEVARIGALDEGVSRVAFSTEEKKAQEWLVKKLKATDINAYIDSVGNVIGVYEGKTGTDIVIGSHLDTVPSGGIFDGALGVLSALEVVETLSENKVKLPFGVRVVSFVAEEGGPAGGTFGSRCVIGDIKKLDKDILESVNLTSEDIINSKWDKEKVRAYIELHIEQGNVLEHEDKSIGVVTGIVGIHRFRVKIAGLANHAGTTPMNLRDDALLKTTYFIQDFYKHINHIGGDLVGTIGVLNISPGAMNVIPGEVELIIEMRSMDFSKTDEVINKLKEKYGDNGYIYDEIVRKDGVKLYDEMVAIIEQVAKKLDYSYKVMQSGAGHDANPMAKITPTGMIFVPSIEGISHSPREYSRWIDIEKGANVLLSTILKIK
jgi:hydantoinase/carbamoylase family amidase